MIYLFINKLTLIYVFFRKQKYFISSIDYIWKTFVFVWRLFSLHIRIRAFLLIMMPSWSR